MLVNRVIVGEFFFFLVLLNRTAESLFVWNIYVPESLAKSMRAIHTGI